MTARLNSWINLPGETGREFWRREAVGAWQRMEGTPDAGAGCIVGIEALALDSAPFWAVAPADGTLDLDNVASLRWEAQGVEPDPEGKSWVCWPVNRADGKVLAGTVALANEAPVETWMDLKPEAFELSARLFPIPEGEAALWKENGRYVLAVNRGEKLLHVGVLAERTLGREAAEEIRDMIVSLEVNEFIVCVRGLRIWTEAGDEFKKHCKDVLAAKVKLEAKPSPVLPAEPCELLPPSVAAGRREAASMKRKLQLVATAAVLYVLCFAVWSGFLFWKQKQLNDETLAFAHRQPEVEQIRQARARWRALESSTNPDTYPAEIFHRLVALLPPEGVQFELFDMKDDHVVIKGVARSLHDAAKFKQDLLDSKDLNQYNWNFQQPISKSDGRASFQTDGALIGGSFHK